MTAAPAAFEAALIGRSLTTLYAYWRERAGPDGVMARTALPPVALTAVLPDLFIMGRGDDGIFRYRLIGTRVQAHIRTRVEGLTVAEVRRGPLVDHLTALFQTAGDAPAAGFGVSALDGESSPLAVYRRLVLPMTTDGARVDQLAGAWSATIERPDDPALKHLTLPSSREAPGRLLFHRAG